MFEHTILFDMQQDELREIEIAAINLNPFQPRSHFSTEEIEELAASIAVVGLIQPPIVRPLAKNRYELISGERRLRAAQHAGLKKIPAIIRYYSDSHSAHAALIENIQRVDLNPIEISKSLQLLAKQFNLRQEELAQRLGKKRSTVANYLRLLNLPIAIQDSVSNGSISMGHAKAILSIESEEQQLQLHVKILREELTVREAEKAALKLNKFTAPAVKKRDIFLEQLSDRMRERLGTQVSILGQGTRGRITIDYYNLDDLDRILSILKIEEC